MLVQNMSVHRIVVVTKRPYEAVAELSKHFDIVDEHGEMCIAIGGDGTFLEATRKVDCPILLIRGGERNSLGFHADARVDELPTVIERLKAGDYQVEKHRKLRVTQDSVSSDAVNDAVLFRANPVVIHFKVSYFDEEGRPEPLFPDTVKGDGVIVSSEIGSTGYNYFAGGPVILGADVATVTPICANHRCSIVSEKNFEVELVNNEASLQCDGVEVGRLAVGDTFTVSRSDRLVRIVRLTGMESFSRKLSRLHGF